MRSSVLVIGCALAPAVAAWVTPAPSTRRAPRVVASASASAIEVELLQFLPMMPPLAPGAESQPLYTVEGVSAPVWLPAFQGIAVLDDAGEQLLLDEEAAYTLGSGVCAHATVATSEGAVLVACDDVSGAVLPLCASVQPDEVGAAMPLPVTTEGIGAPLEMLTAVSNGRLLAGATDGRLLRLSADDAPTTLLTGVSGMRSACMSADDRTLFLCTDGGVLRASIDLDEGTCESPEWLSLELPEGAAPTAIAIDTSDHLFVCTAEGVTVCSPSGEALARASTPEAVTGCCFGGASLADLYLAAGDTLWRLKTNTQGVEPPTAAFLKKMDKLTAAGEFRHEGW
mmetsp:Transcript_33709/g.88638  ORF Transcript_33709/g.88638 Transcript_33709/m.88638 type:complete len:341 (+) Transcript_33709:1-1023(+)